MQKQIITEYWRCDKQLLNLGDYVTEILLNHFGYKIRYHHALSVEERSNPIGSCLLIIGSLFAEAWFNKIPGHKIVWGCGYWGDPQFSLKRLEECSIHLVRGPLTRRKLGLSDKIPIGDPALLMGTLFPKERQSHAGVAYVPHFNSRDKIRHDTLEKLGAEQWIDVACSRSEFWDRIQRIVNADFLLTSSLHAAIIAESYGRPWALVVPVETTLDKPMKWQDWFELLELDARICKSAVEAKDWWFTEGIKRRKVALEPILKSFPHNVAF